MNWSTPFSKVVVEVLSFVWRHSVRHVTYIVRYKQSVHELKDSVKDLENEKDKIDHQSDEADKNLKNIEGKVTEWSRKVSEIKTTVEVFENDDGHKRARSLNCYVFPYLWNRHRLGRQATKMEMGVKKIIDESPKLDEISYRENVTSNDATLSNYGFEEFGSTKSTMEKVMRQLENSSVRMVGLYGEGGVGKSALIKEIARIARDKKLFNVVVKVEITANPNLQSIQEEIAYVFGLQLEGEGENVRADCLRRRLKKEKGNTLLILDDLWHKLDLNKLGIVSDDNDDNDDLSNDMRDLDDKFLKKDKNHTDLNQNVLKREKVIGGYKGCKILLTARQKRVLEVEMDVKSTFRVEPLDDNDALMFFQKLSGIHNMSDSRKEIVKKYCAGLPMAIITVAKALRGKSELVWEAALGKLEKKELVGVQTYMDISVKMSYDHLENEEIKSIFLLCAQMGHQPLIMDLVKCCFGLGILEGVFSLWEARDKIKITIQKLKDSGLLLDGNSDIHFNMHDIVRDAALSIANKEKNVFTLRNGKLDEWPELKRCTSMSICNCDIIDELPIVNCSRLKFFQIDTNNQSLTIPDKFFEGMKNLKVLILAGFHLKRFPPSIKSLLKLRMLCLERCTLEDNLSIGELKKLRILSFSGSQLKSLPTELGYLDKLQLLDITDCSILEINIPPNILSSLTHLEELYIRKSLIKMLVEGGQSHGQNSFLSQLKNLHQLKVVDLSIPCFSVLPNHLFYDKLKDYKIVVGDVEMFSVIGFKMLDKYETFRVLALQLNHDTNIDSQEDINLLFKTAQSLLLGKVEVVKVVNELNIDGFPDLKHLSIIDSNAIIYVNSMKLSNCINVFPNLESLCLYNLKNLEMIFYGPLTVASFAKLKSIKVNMCVRLVTLYSVYIVELPNSEEPCEIIECNSYLDKFCATLEIVEVSECEALKEILLIPMNCDKVKFLKLHTLTFQSLPSFTCFYTEVEESCWPHPTKPQAKNSGSEEDQKSFNPPPLFGEQVEIPNLESLNLCSLNIHKIWSDQLSSSFCFQSLIKLVVKDCDKLTYLCSLSVASSLKKLKSLIISECPIMEKIFETKENNADKVCVFPKLEEIHLSKMRRLRDIWHTKVNIDSFSSLISVNIEECNKLDKIFPINMEGWFESLDNLKVYKCQSVEVIFEIKDYEEIDASGGISTNLQVILLQDLPKLKELWSKDPHGVIHFKKLRTIDVSNCHELWNLFPTSMAKDVSKLEHISIWSCKKMVEIVSSKDTSEANNHPLEFSELTYVRLYLLPNIKHFYKGRHPIKCPKLKELIVSNCRKLKTFSKEISKTTEEEESFVFSAPKVLSKLEYMQIDFKEAQNLLPKYPMHRLKELSLTSVESVDFLNRFPYRTPNLEKLKLICSSKELEPRVNFASEERLRITLELKELVLWRARINDLTGVSIVRKLELLSLVSCNQLNNLGPSSVSLTYLTYLELYHCEKLKYLMTPSTAKNMVQLKTMKVINCPKVKEIVSNELSEEGTEMKIVFSKLITIELVKLVNLATFCSYKDCEFEFPSLEILIVRECLKMEKFSEREAITPKLKNVFGVEGDEKSKWHWEGNLNDTIHKIFFDKVSFAYTEDLRLDNHTHQFIIEQLCDGRHLVQQNSFGYLKSLTAWGCDSVVHVIPFHLLSCFHNLEKLNVGHCVAAEVIFNMNDEKRVMTKPLGIFRLKSLSLCKLSNLEHVWDKDPEGTIGLQLLKEMRVEECERLISLFPASVAKDLTRLEVLEVTKCKELAEIFKKDRKDEQGQGTTLGSVFPHLTTLTLEKLPRLTYSIHFSKHESISNLSDRDKQELCLGSRCIIPNSYFGLLESLILDGCQFLSDVLLPFNVLSFLTNLETLKVRNCDSVKTIFDVNPSTQDTSITFPIKNLVLSKLPELEAFWNADPHGILCMQHIKKVEVKECKSLRSVFPASVAKDLELEDLVMEECERLVGIVAEDNSDPNLQLTLPCPYLRSLKLRRLQKFTYFYYCSHKSVIYTHLDSRTEHQLPNEKCMSVGENGMKMIFRGGFEKKVLDSLKALTLCFGSDVFECKILEQVPNIEKLVVRDSSFKKMFCCESCDNVLQQMKVLQLEFLEKLVSIGLENSWTDSFVRNLETFKVISSKGLGKLKRMEIKDCYSIEEIACRESDEDEIVFPQLTCLNLDSLWKLRRFYGGSLGFPSLEELSVTFCDEMISLCVGSIESGRLSQVIIDSKEIPHFCFSYLETLIVNGCQFLSYVLPYTLLPLLPQLQTLQVRNCDSVKTIFDVKCVQGTLTSPLKTLVLWKLPNLETLWNEDTDEIVTQTNPVDSEGTNPKLTFPSLASLTIWDLPNFKHNTIYCIHDGATPTFELIIPNLENLIVGKDELKMIVEGEFHRNHSLKVLGLCFDIECDEFPEYGFLQQLPNVKKLVVWSSSFKVIFCHQKPNNTELLLQLNEVRLESLGELVSIGLENSWTEPFVRNLEIFEVIRCSSLENLVTCTVSFSNLRCLNVGNCDGLLYLFTSSTAKSLGRLQRMEIKKCKSIEEIVSKEGEESDEDEIIFPQLNCRLKADKLSLVRIYYHNSPLKTDLNSTMRKEFGRKISKLNELDLKSRPGLQEIWRGALHIPDFCFSELDTLIVEDCQFLSDAVLPFHLLSLLPKLKTLEVRNCDSVKTIFPESVAKDIVKLEALIVEHCQSLRAIVAKEYSEGEELVEDEMIFSQLIYLKVESCNSLPYLFRSSTAKCLGKLEIMAINKCKSVEEIISKKGEESDENVEIKFEQLRDLYLEKLDGLRLQMLQLHQILQILKIPDMVTVRLSLRLVRREGYLEKAKDFASGTGTSCTLVPVFLPQDVRLESMEKVLVGNLTQGLIGPPLRRAPNLHRSWSSCQPLKTKVRGRPTNRNPLPHKKRAKRSLLLWGPSIARHSIGAFVQCASLTSIFIGARDHAQINSQGRRPWRRHLSLSSRLAYVYLKHPSSRVRMLPLYRGFEDHTGGLSARSKGQRQVVRAIEVHSSCEKEAQDTTAQLEEYKKVYHNFWRKNDDLALEVQKLYGTNTLPKRETCFSKKKLSSLQRTDAILPSFAI
ncbi:disease resistance protein [Vigna angularis]|uniref:Disease resistance protein n=1 Tax=Phaseolus angularis TaxID=3914 RepID=A0A8T0JQB8_PHAAN|nr:disease resistance protein [Vigna angularis]